MAARVRFNSGVAAQVYCPKAVSSENARWRADRVVLYRD